MVAIMRRALVLTVALLACCAPAQAATVTARQYEELTKVEEKVTVTDVEYRADPGEVNVVRLWIEGDRLRIADSGAPLRAVGLCDQIDAHEASCPRVGGIPISTGDGDDTVTTPLDDPDAPAARVFAGEGDDRLSGAGELHGGPGDDVITLGILTRHEGGSAQGSRGKGGEGDDTITGSDGGDVLWGGGGRNTLLAGAGDDYVFEGDTRGAGDWDVLDGGAGQDWLGYSGHDEDLFADLRSAGQQIIAVPTGALDDVRGFESLLTGSGADTIIGEGSDRATYSSGPGDDLVRAGPGMDSVHMGKGNDRVLAAGDDLLKDYIDCGPGRDSVVAETGDDAHECEHADLHIAPRPVTRMQRKGAWLRPIFNCAGVVSDCHGFTNVYWRTRHGWRAVRYRIRIVCDTKTVPCASHARGGWARLGRRARRTLGREGRLEIRVESVLEARNDPQGAPYYAEQFYVMRASGVLVGDPSPILPADLH